MSFLKVPSWLERMMLALLLWVYSPVVLAASHHKQKPALAHKKEIRTSSQLADETLGKVLRGYHAWGLVEINVEKRISSEWKPQTSISHGKIFYSKGKIRWEVFEPEKTWLIYDGKTVWNVQFPNQDFNESKNKVIIAKVTSKNRDSLLLIDLLDSRIPSDHFIIKMEDPKTFSLEPKKSSNWRGIRNLLIKVENSQVVGVSYKDDINNKVEISLGNTVRKKEKNLELFMYKVNPSKDDVVEH